MKKEIKKTTQLIQSWDRKARKEKEQQETANCYLEMCGKLLLGDKEV